MKILNAEESKAYARDQLYDCVRADSWDGDLSLFTHEICDEAGGTVGYILDAKAVEEYAYFIRDYKQQCQSIDEERI